jgi:hypothetical protein
MEIIGIRDKIEAAKKKAEKEYEEKQQAEWDKKLADLDHGRHVELDDDEIEFILENMKNDFFGTVPNEEKQSKWELVMKIAGKLKASNKEITEIDAVEPQPTKRMASLCFSAPYFISFDPEETKMIAELYYLSDYSFVSALGTDVSFVFNISDIWRDGSK